MEPPAPAYWTRIPFRPLGSAATPPHTEKEHMATDEPVSEKCAPDWRLAAITILLAVILILCAGRSSSHGTAVAETALSAFTLLLAVWLLISTQRTAADSAQQQPPANAPASPLLHPQIETATWDLLHHLTTVNGYCDLLLQSHDQSTAANRADLAEIRHAGERSLLTALSLQWLTGIRRPKSQPFSLNPLVLDLEPRLKAALPPSTTLHLQLDPQAGAILHDPELLDWLIVALVISSPHPAVTISTTRATVEIQGAGNPELSAVAALWRQSDGALNTATSAVSLSAPALSAPVAASNSTLVN